MKSIFLIGDSIRYGAPNSSPYNAISPGYERYVRHRLDTVASVFGPNENCRFAQFTLRFLHKWAGTVPKETIDVVHWNNGLWDALRLFGDEPLTPIDVYISMLRRINTRIRLLFPNAQVIFALSTAVIEEREKPEFMRYNREIEMYNRAAAELMKELDIPVNDLYTLSYGFDPSLYADAVHFTEAGSDLLAAQVVETCRKYLNV